MKLVLLIICCLFACKPSSYGQSIPDKDVINWTREFYKKSPFVKTDSDVSVQFVETIKSGKFIHSIYFVGINVSGVPKMILIREKEENLKYKYLVIGNKSLKLNMDGLYNFFLKKSSFSDKTKILCYEILIIKERNTHGVVR